MARRRMFSLDVVDTDSFLDLPSSSQALYFHLGMRADDDGFVSSPKRITATVGASPDDLRLLVAKGLIIPFESGVCVIRDWKVNNYLRSDRYTPTLYQTEKAQLEAGSHTGGMSARVPFGIPKDIPPVNTGKDRLGKDRLGEGKQADKPPRTRFIPPSLDEIKAYCQERGNGVDAQRFLDFYEANGWVQGKGKPIRDWKAALRTWERNDKTCKSAPDFSWRKERSFTPDELIEYPTGSGKYIPRVEVTKDA